MLFKDNSSVATPEITLLKQKIENKNLETAHLQQKLLQKNQEIAELRYKLELNKKQVIFGLKEKLTSLIKGKWINREYSLPGAEYFVKYPEIVIIKASQLFDRDWYFTQYPDVKLAEMEPEQHYLELGAGRGYNPSANFSTNEYRSLYPDVRRMNPLVHYELYGRAEGRVCPVEKEISTSGFFLLEKKIKMIFISGEPETPGHIYRISRYTRAAKAMGAHVIELDVPSASENLEEIYRANILIVWRATWSDELSSLMSAARKAKVPVIYDIDDLIIDPNLAKVNIVDGIRSSGSTEKAAEKFFELMQISMKQADYCSAPTHFLADYMSSFGKKTFHLPNGFDENTWRVSRLALRARLTKPHDGLIRMGYAGGSRTHQKDFAKIAGVIASLLRERSHCRLVLFSKGKKRCIDIDEFPTLNAVSAQIEWREMVPLNELPLEMAQFDINLAPLEVGNAFCEAKSELKFFESALVEVPVVASPTQTFSEAIEDGKTGFLAPDEKSWYIILSKLLDDALLRKNIGRNAYYSVLWKYGREHRMELISSMLDIIFYPGARAARAFELSILKSKNACYKQPIISAHEKIVSYEKENISEVTVVVPNYNTSHSLIERLDSVKNQTLLNIDLIIVDDCSTDNSIEIASQWIAAQKNRFNRVMLIKNNINSGFGLASNVGFSNAETLFVIHLSPNNKLLADYAANCLTKIKESNAAFVYSNVREINGSQPVISPYDPLLFTNRNFVRGTALIRLAAWAYVGGYHQLGQGSYNYDFWCKFVENGLFGHHVDETLTMKITTEIHSRHSWILSDHEVS